MNSPDNAPPPEAAAAQQRLQERRRELGVKPSADPVTAESALQASLNRLAQVTRNRASPPPAPQKDKTYERQRAPPAMCRSTGCPLRHLLNHRSGLDRSGPWQETLTRIRARLGSGFLVALVGVRGNGKTQMGLELVLDVVKRGFSALFCSSTEFFMAIKRTYRPGSTEDEEDVIRRYRKPMLLVIDEMGMRAETPWEDRLLFELLNLRYGDIKDTLLISNQERAVFLESIGTSLASRMSETGGIVDCHWSSYRAVGATAKW